MKDQISFWDRIIELRESGKIPLHWKRSDIRPFLKDFFSGNTINSLPSNQSQSIDGQVKGDYVKKGANPIAYRVSRGVYTLIDDPLRENEKVRRVFGQISGYPPGSLFNTRKELHDSGVHRPTQAGISGSGDEGADSIVLSGGYEDD